MRMQLLGVVICFQISIFEPLKTTRFLGFLWKTVVICFQISIFEPLKTTFASELFAEHPL